MTLFGDVVGTAEAAEMLGVATTGITRWRKAGRMPTTAAELAATPVWWREDVERVKRGEDFRPDVERLDVVGTAEVAELLGVDRSQIGRWRRNGQFPEPAHRLAAGPFWYRSDVAKLAVERKAHVRK